MPLDFDSEVDFVDQNVRYMDELYSLEGTRFDAWRDWIRANLEDALSSYTSPAGKVIQAGTWNGDFYNELKRIYGNDRCVGFDIVEYIEDDTIIHGDFRTIHSANNMDCAIFYNGLGTWENNVTSKQAGLTYALANLAPGGIYLEPKTPLAIETLQAEAGLNPDGLRYLGLYSGGLIICRKP